MRSLLVIATVVAAAALAGVAQGSSRARDPRVPTLQRTVSALQSQVATLKNQVQHDELVNACLWATQVKFNLTTVNVFNIMFGQPEISTAVDDHGTYAAVGLQPPRVLQSRFPLVSLAYSLSARVETLR